ncbi:heparinase II/III domain-containing protein [Streptobacillus canis]|uniref:heparinase II/III domain-containing protein n=1 Tax=Streptobacillus canis TaxID=2678686 RepID=UPI0012E2B861|nr:heparinase II/III family protein [Streptobacillus canis]
MFNYSKKYRYVLLNFKVDKYLKQAKRIMDNKLNFIHPWDMERCSNYYVIPEDWNEYVNEDEEWIFMRSRMNYFDSLFLAYEKYLDNKYLDRVKELIFDFIDRHSELTYELSTRTLDSGIRIVNILRALVYLKELGYLLEEEELKIVKHLDKTCLYLFDSFVEKYYHSNWGYIQMVGIYTFGLIYKKSYAKKAKEYMEIQLNTQILADGLHLEKSMTYHYQMLIYTIWVVMIEKECKIKDDFFLIYLSKMTDAAEKLHYPNLKQINFGDSDDDNIEDILSLANAILGRKSFYSLKETSLMFGGTYTDNYRKINKKNNMNEYYLKDSGYYHLTNKNYSFSTYLTNMTSGHLHVDLFHFNYFNKKEILVDNGRYTYLENNEYRNYLKSALAHNTFILDNKEFIRIKNSWEYNGKYPLINPIDIMEDNGVRCVRLNVFDIESNSYFERKFILFEENVIIINKIYSKGKHNLKMRYHFHPKIEINELEDKLLLNKGIYFELGKYSLEKGIYSSKYNEKKESKFVNLEYDFENEIEIVHKILNKDVKVEVINTDKNILAFKVYTKNMQYIIFTKNEDNIMKQNVSYIENKPFYKNFKVIIESRR